MKLEKNILKSWADKTKRINTEVDYIISNNHIPNTNEWQNKPVMDILTDVRWVLDNCIFTLVYFNQYPPGYWKTFK